VADAIPEAFSQALNCHPNLDSVLGDGIYGCRWITNMVSENNATSYFLPRNNVTFKSKGAMGWYDMLYSLGEYPHEWLEHYHMRSISETVNSMVKYRFGAPLRKKLDSRKATETRLKLVGTISEEWGIWRLWVAWCRTGVEGVHEFCLKAIINEKIKS
jgi:transposase